MIGIMILILRYIMLLFLYLFIVHVVRLIYRNVKVIDNGSVPKAQLIEIGSGGAEAGKSDFLGENNIVAGYAQIYMHQGKYWICKLGHGRYPLVNGSSIRGNKVLFHGDTIETGEMTLQFREVEKCRQKSSRMLV